MAKQTPKENPLKSKNIPQPPSIMPEQPSIPQYRKTVEDSAEPQNINTVKQEDSKTVESGIEAQSSNTASQPQTVKLQNTVKQQGTKTAQREKITFYLEPEQANKVYDMMETFRRRTGVKINQQDMLRRIIDVIDPSSVLP